MVVRTFLTHHLQIGNTCYLSAQVNLASTFKHFWALRMRSHASARAFAQRAFSHQHSYYFHSVSPFKLFTFIKNRRICQLIACTIVGIGNISKRVFPQCSLMVDMQICSRIIIDLHCNLLGILETFCNQHNYHHVLLC